MFCAGCGNNLTGMDGDFCAMCGKRVEGQELQAEAQVKTQASPVGVLAKKKVNPWMIVAAVVVVAAIVFAVVALSGGELDGRWESEWRYPFGESFVIRGNRFTYHGYRRLSRPSPGEAYRGEVRGTFSISIHDGFVFAEATHLVRFYSEGEVFDVAFLFEQTDEGEKTFMLTDGARFTRTR